MPTKYKSDITRAVHRAAKKLLSIVKVKGLEVLG